VVETDLLGVKVVREVVALAENIELKWQLVMSTHDPCTVKLSSIKSFS